MPRSFVSTRELPPDISAGLAIRSAATMLGEPEGRRISFVLSDESVARDNHIIKTSGWQLDNYRANPVVLLGHDDSTPPIARTVEIGPVGSLLLATAEFPDADVYPLGDTIYRMLKGGFMNAASVGWLPLEWKAANDRKRPGGLDFSRQELLEWSVVSVPSLPSALVTARSSGVDTRPLFDWAERLLDSGDFAVIAKSDLEALRGAARMPAKKPAVPPAAAPAPPQRDLSAFIRAAKKRNLYTLADLACTLAGLENTYDRIAAEAQRENDGSEMPVKFRAWLDDGNRLLLDMAGEETQEQIDGTQDDAPTYFWSAETLAATLERTLDARGLTRKGAKYSAETVRCMRAIHKHLGAAHQQMSDLLNGADDQALPEADPEAEGDEDMERAARAARAAEIKAKHTA
jgi:hypothetical protein